MLLLKLAKTEYDNISVKPENRFIQVDTPKYIFDIKNGNFYLAIPTEIESELIKSSATDFSSWVCPFDEQKVGSLEELLNLNSRKEWFQAKDEEFLKMMKEPIKN